jgi:phosphopantothenoylcysteine decarboxylase/phosphopantothenate--cysteine ligase
MLHGKKILLGITGSIAAYKSIMLVRLLSKAGAEVKIVMTAAAKTFVSPLVLSTLSKNPVLHDLSDDDVWANHVMLGRWADIMMMAPLSCCTLAKMANGLCDNLLMAVYLSATCPVIVAPAMDEDMWLHPATQKNLKTVNSYGNKIIPVGKGELASGLNGFGRMAEPEEIILFLKNYFSQKQDFVGRKVLVTAGPTYEPLDPVRFIGNHSSGKMGIALANHLYNRGAEVILVLGPTHLKAVEGIKTINVQTANEMFEACMDNFPNCDIAIMAAAVADYGPKERAENKIKKKEDTLTIELIKNPDILKSCGQIKKDNQFLLGFALETNNEAFFAKEKLRNKNADAIVLNSLNDEGAGFGKDTNKITIFDKNEDKFFFDTMTKDEAAKKIIDFIINKLPPKGNWI